MIFYLTDRTTLLLAVEQNPAVASPKQITTTDTTEGINTRLERAKCEHCVALEARIAELEQCLESQVVRDQNLETQSPEVADGNSGGTTTNQPDHDLDPALQQRLNNQIIELQNNVNRLHTDLQLVNNRVSLLVVESREKESTIAELRDRNIELETKHKPEPQHQVVSNASAGQGDITLKQLPDPTDQLDPSSMLIDFGFSYRLPELKERLIDLTAQVGIRGTVYFKGRIDREAGKVIEIKIEKGAANWQ